MQVLHNLAQCLAQPISAAQPGIPTKRQRFPGHNGPPPPQFPGKAIVAHNRRRLGSETRQRIRQFFFYYGAVWPSHPVFQRCLRRAVQSAADRGEWPSPPEPPPPVETPVIRLAPFSGSISSLPPAAERTPLQQAQADYRWLCEGSDSD